MATVSSTGNTRDALSPIRWPRKRNVVGVRISEATYDDVVEAVITAARRRQSAVASFFAVHAVVTAAGDPSLRAAVEEFDIAAPDGQPVRWALNVLHRSHLPSNVRGAETMWRICARAAQEGVSIYLYGGAPGTLAALQSRLAAAFPTLRIAGAESPPFRPLTSEEDQDVVRRINGSGAGIVVVGLGCPKQDWFAAQHRARIAAVQVCVGAAFDFHAGHKAMAPAWIQRAGLEWLHRLCHEPRRLWKRYLTTNTLFVYMFARQAAAMALCALARPRGADPSAPARSTPLAPPAHHPQQS